MTNILLLLKLLSSHVIADFFLQFDWLCKGKREEGMRGIAFQAIHALIHAACAYVLVGDWCGWIIPLVIFITHIIIDITKVKWFPTSTVAFLIDQLAHIAVMIGLWWALYADQGIELAWLSGIAQSDTFWAILIGYMLMLKPRRCSSACSSGDGPRPMACRPRVCPMQENGSDISSVCLS